MSQTWLNRRLHGIQPANIDPGVRSYSTAYLTPPETFENAWATYNGPHQQLTEDELATASCILVFCNPFVEAEVQTLCHLVTAVDALGHVAPPMFWVPHTTAPEVRPEDAAIDVEADHSINVVMDLGLDGVVAGEPEGFRLVLAVRAKMYKSASLSQNLNQIVNERRARVQQTEFLKDCVHCILWDYLRIRLAGNIPPVDFNLPSGQLSELGNWRFGQLLGEGTQGTVYHLSPILGTGESSDVPQVVKVVGKTSLKELHDLKAMKRMISIMQILSSDEFEHPSVVKLYEIYHSPTHLFFRMEHGGPENLYRRLSYREKPGDRCRPLSFDKTVSLIQQAIASVAHLHIGPRICHRDLKPENFIVQDGPDVPLVLKLADFDLAVILEGNSVCRNHCGTMPFTAPEVFLQKEYDGAASDIWSLAVVLLEVLCGVRVLERALNLQAMLQPDAAGRQPDDALPRRIRAAFQTPGSASQLLQNHCRHDLQELIPAYASLLDGMLTVVPPDRWKAADISSHL